MDGSKGENPAAAPKKRVVDAIRVAIIHVLALAAVVRIFVGVSPSLHGGDDTSNVSWIGQLAAAGLGVAIVSVLVLCDDFALQRRFFARCGGAVTARYVVNAICRVVCALYCAACVVALCVGTIYLGPFLLAAYHVTDTFLVLLAALRLADLILWLIERKRKNVRK